MTPEQSGLWLLDRMRRQIGLATLESIQLLDFGYGVRFSQAILNTGFPIGAYTGVDNCRAMIEFLQRNVRDRRMSYVLLDAQHQLYNEAGPEGHLFFTCFVDDTIPSFEDRSAEQNGGRCFYNTSFLKDLVESCGWREVNRAPGVNPLIGDSFVFRTAGTRS